jgi:hypothetical protein
LTLCWSEWEFEAMEQVEIDKAWSRSIASLAVHGLSVARIVAEADIERAVEIVAEEILVRLALEDRPDATNWRYKSK